VENKRINLPTYICDTHVLHSNKKLNIITTENLLFQPAIIFIVLLIYEFILSYCKIMKLSQNFDCICMILHNREAVSKIVPLLTLL
jgi:hypothetical protein